MPPDGDVLDAAAPILATVIDEWAGHDAAVYTVITRAGAATAL
jgi:hypothetical protein